MIDRSAAMRGQALLVFAADELFPEWRWSATAGVPALLWTVGDPALLL